MAMLRKVTTRELPELYDHMRRDFPLRERLPYFMLRESTLHGRLKACYLVEEDGAVCGYAVCVAPKGSGYFHIQYIAVLPEHRSKGYGGQFLELLSKRYEGRKIILEVEDPEKADGEEERRMREKRIGFYQRAGLRLLNNMTVRLFGVSMLCMTNDPEPLEDPRSLWLQCYLLATGSRWMLKVVDPVVHGADLGRQGDLRSDYAAKIPTGVYRHFKGGEYRVLCLARHSETEEVQVVYQALYGDKSVWVRPASMWNEMVRQGDVIGPRFIYTGRDGE